MDVVRVWRHGGYWLGILAVVVCLGGAPRGWAQNQGYRINASDLIVIDVVGEKDLTAIEKRVSPKGTISFPYLGDIEVQGKTAAETERYLRDLLIKEEYFVNPQVVLRVKEYKKRQVTVLGQVNRQGVVEFPSEQGMNLLEAIGMAAGFTQLADTREITISRGAQKTTFNYKDFLKKPKEANLPSLEPGDVVMVPEAVF